MGIDNKANILSAQGKSILAGSGTDGTPVSIAEDNVMRDEMQKEFPGLVWTWCFGH